MARPKKQGNKPLTRNPNGMGTIYRYKDGRYEWKKVKDGETMVKSSKDKSVVLAAQKKYADLSISKSKLKVNDWFEMCLESISSLKAKATAEQYTSIYKEHIAPVIGKKKMVDVEQYHIQNVITEMSKKTKQKRVKDKKTGKYIKVDTGEKLSTWTMKHARKVMRIIFEKATENKVIPKNPVEKIEIPKRQAKTRKTLTSEELNIMFRYLKNTRWIWCFKFMLVTGLRRGEVLALKWSDINEEAMQITVEDNNTDSGTGDTKSRKVHYVTLTDKAKEYLRGQKNMLELENNPGLKNEELKKLDLVFPSKEGTMLKPDSLNSVLDRMNKATGLHVTPHMFRHTYVYLSKGILTLSELQENLGHDESTTTLDIYGTMLSDSKSVANKLNKAFENIDAEQSELPANVIDIRERIRRAK
jgi:integrase